MADEAESTAGVSPAPATEGQSQQPEPTNEEQEEVEEEVEEESGPPDHPTLNTKSLSNLAAAVGSDGLKLAMCLNVPTTSLIQIQFQGLDSGWNLDNIVSNMLFYWKLMRKGSKDRDKVNDLVRALRHVDLNELADAVDQSFQQEAELSDLPTKQPREGGDGDPSATAEDSPTQ